MRAPILLAILLFMTHRSAAMAVAATVEKASPGGPLVLQVRLDDESINPVTVRFVERAIRQAEQQRAECLVFVMDTPGGLVESTRHLVRTILRSNVPIVVYIAPAGARAASAGVFITLASHVAAMAPGTNIGAARPVQIGGLPGIAPHQPDDDVKTKRPDQPLPPATPLEEKSLNDTVAWARSLAELRGRNAEWAARSVKESLSASALEAVQVQAVDLVAEDVADLLRQIDGREVVLPHHRVRLRTANASIHSLEMWWGERLLSTLANPNVAFLLLILGFYGILFELYTPGWGVSGTLGIIFLVLGFFALAVLPINYVGLALIALALGLFIAEIFVTSYGFLTIGGIACLILGGLMLVESPLGFQRISLWILAPCALATASITLFLLGKILRVQKSPARTGSEGLIGANAVAEETFSPSGAEYRGVVRLHGELWNALCAVPIAQGDTVHIQSRRGLTLLAAPAESNGTVPRSRASKVTSHTETRP